MNPADQVLNRLIEQIVQPVVNLLFVVALLVFFWGIFQMIKGADNEDARADGKRVMLWGTIGLIIMFGAYGIIAVIKGTFGI